MPPAGAEVLQPTTAATATGRAGRDGTRTPRPAAAVENRIAIVLVAAVHFVPGVTIPVVIGGEGGVVVVVVVVMIGDSIVVVLPTGATSVFIKAIEELRAG